MTILAYTKSDVERSPYTVVIKGYHGIFVDNFATASFKIIIKDKCKGGGTQIIKMNPIIVKMKADLSEGLKIYIKEFEALKNCSGLTNFYSRKLTDSYLANNLIIKFHEESLDLFVNYTYIEI